jgi:hypothetical protein
MILVGDQVGGAKLASLFIPGRISHARLPLSSSSHQPLMRHSDLPGWMRHLLPAPMGEPPATTFPADPGAVLDLGGGEIKRSEARDDPMWAVLSSRMFQIAALMLLLSLSVILWMSNDHPVQIAQVREQARAVIAEHRSGPDRGFSSNPLLLFQASLAEAAPAEVTLRGKVYVPAYSTIRVTTGRARINLATTLSIHNTSSERPLTLERVDYHNTQGELGPSLP